MTVRDLAGRVKVSAATISGIENDKIGVSVARLHELADAMGISAAQLLTAGGGGLRASLDQTRPTTGADRESNWREFPPLDIDPVMRVAIDCFVEMGYHATTMRTLAARIGVSVPTIYHHYADKQQLLVRILDMAMRELHWRVAAARAQAKTSREEIPLIVEALALFHTRRQKLAFIGASEMRSLEGAARQRIVHSRNLLQHNLDQAIDRAIADGFLAPSNPRPAARAISTMCTSLPQWFNADGALTPSEVALAYADFAMSILGAQRAGTDTDENGAQL